jgi:hypothetical protein
MKKYTLLYLAIHLTLSSCASTTGSGSSQSSSDDGSFEMIGAAVSVLLGLVATQQSGDAAQGQQIMQQSLNIFSSNSNSDSSDSSANLLASNSSAGIAETPTAETSSFNGAKYMPGSGCEKNLSYLASRLKKFPPTEVNSIRNEIISTDMHTTMLKINQMGLSPQTAIQQSLQQAVEHDRTAREAVSTAGQVDALGTTDEEFERNIKSGKLSISDCSGIRDSSLCVAVINKYGAIANRAVAANLMCYKRTNQWPM